VLTIGAISGRLELSGLRFRCLSACRMSFHVV
jgi:hypothetical protein